MNKANLEMNARCRKEWELVNDPPCHPSDPGWAGCPICRDGPHATACRERVSAIIEAARAVSSLVEGREVYVPLALLIEVEDQLLDKEAIEEALG